jgi:hypothetical protein
LETVTATSPTGAFSITSNERDGLRLHAAEVVALLEVVAEHAARSADGLHHA